MKDAERLRRSLLDEPMWTEMVEAAMEADGHDKLGEGLDVLNAFLYDRLHAYTLAGMMYVLHLSAASILVDAYRREGGSGGVLSDAEVAAAAGRAFGAAVLEGLTLAREAGRQEGARA